MFDARAGQKPHIGVSTKISALLATESPRKRRRVFRKRACAYDFRVRCIVFGNAIGNNIVGAIEHSKAQDELRDALDRAGVKYDFDESGNVRSGQRVSLGYAQQLLNNGATPEQVGAIFGNSTLKDGLTTLDYATGKLSDAEASNRAVAYLNQLQAGSSGSPSQASPDAGGIGLVITANRNSPSGESIFGDLLSGGLGVIHGLNELYSNPLTEGLANLAYGASKVVLGGGPLKTVAYQLGKVAASASLDQGVHKPTSLSSDPGFHEQADRGY